MSARRFAQLAVAAGGVREGFRRYLDLMFVFYVVFSSAYNKTCGSLAAVIRTGVAVDLEGDRVPGVEFDSECHASGVFREPAG